MKSAQMPTPSYSTAVLQGLLKSGLSEEDISSRTFLTAAEQRDILAGTSALTDGQIQAIEQVAGLTAAQLAALAPEPHGGPLTTLNEVWADARLVSSRQHATEPR